MQHSHYYQTLQLHPCDWVPHLLMCYTYLCFHLNFHCLVFFKLLIVPLYMCIDIKTKHDSGGLCDGMDPSQQALLKGSESVSHGCGYWCWCLHCKWCKSYPQRLRVCLSSSFINIFAANCKYHILLFLSMQAVWNLFQFKLWFSFLKSFYMFDAAPASIPDVTSNKVMRKVSFPRG